MFKVTFTDGSTVVVKARDFVSAKRKGRFPIGVVMIASVCLVSDKPWATCLYVARVN
jgi:hypothetical protein